MKKIYYLLFFLLTGCSATTVEEPEKLTYESKSRIKGSALTTVVLYTKRHDGCLFVIATVPGEGVSLEHHPKCDNHVK